VALLLDTDVGLLFHLFALMGMGVPVLLLSARLSPTAIEGLLMQTSASAILASPRLTRTAKEALALHTSPNATPRLHIAEPFQQFLDKPMPKSSSSICHEGHYVADTDRNVVILNSSGTTGLPKAI
ncbi:uncharacterized protein BDZ99DRAFT_356747, partial [Mytilinidion resinicola]